MAEAVDAIIADLSVRYQQYVDGFDKATAAHDRFTKSVPKIGAMTGISASDAQQYADRHTKASNDIGAAAEKSADRVQKSARKTSDADKASATSAKAAAKERADASKSIAAAEKAAAKEAADAAKATAQAERDLQIALARVREGEINDVRKYRAELARLKQDEKEAANQAKANAFLTSPRTPNGLQPLSAASPRSSRAEMRDVFKQIPREDAVAKSVLADPNEIDREAASLLRLANIQKTIDEQAERSARAGRSGPLNGTGVNDGPQRPLASNAAAFINGGASTADVAAEKEVNALNADLITKKAAQAALRGRELRDLKDEIALMELEKRLIAQNVAEEEVLLSIETQRAKVAAVRVAEDRKQSLSGVTKFAEGAGIGRGGSGALVGGLVAASVAGGVYAAAKEGLDYANNLSILSKQLGLTTRDLQVYQSAAETLGVTNEQLRTSFGQLASNIGKAQEGAKEQGKIFGKDGLAIDLGNARDGYKSLGDLLPSIVERFTSIKDPARRAALETALFGESGRKLDSLLSGGTGAIKALGDELVRTGAIMSGEDIARSAKVAADLKRVGDQLERELASTVSHNAEAISSLAKSLLEGASALLGFINAFQRFRAIGQIQSGDPKLEAAGRESLNQTPEGRKDARDANDIALRALRNGARSNDAYINLGDNSGIGFQGLLGGRYIANTPQARADARKQIKALRQPIVQAESAAKALDAGADATPQDGHVGNLNVFAPDPKKGPKGKSAEQIEAERLERDKRFTAAEASEQLARLGFLTELTSDTRQQDEYARQRITTESAAKDREIRDEAEKTINSQKLKGDAAALERSRASQLVKENDANTELAIQVINRHEMSRYLEEQLAHAQTASEILVDGLNTQLTLANTVKERVALEKRLLAISIENERLALQKQIDDKATSPADRANAITRRDALAGKQANAASLIDDRNKSPIQRYTDKFDDPQTQIQQAVADKLKSVDDAIASEAAKVLGVKDPFLKSLLQIFLQQNVLKPLYDSLQNANGISGGGILGSAFKLVGGLFGGARANGGNVEPGKSYLVGEHGPEIATFGGRGTIIPNHAIDVAASNRPVNAPSTGNVTVHQSFTLDARYGITTPQLLEHVNQVAAQRASEAGQASYSASVAAAPGALSRKQALGT